ncbi:MAG: hypothetical protein ACLQBL_35035 [Polyangiaceae bacterium]
MIALFGFIFQLRAAERRRSNGGPVVAALRGLLHAVCVVALGVTCPRLFELTRPYHGPWTVLGLACGALCAIASFVFGLTLADKTIDAILAALIADSRGLDADMRVVDFIALRDLARLEVPDAAVFSVLMVAWAAIEACFP